MSDSVGTCVLFVANTPSAEPWYRDVAASLPADEFHLTTLDGSLPLAPQFDGVEVVIDLGGHGTREMIDAAARAGVGLWQAMTAGLDHTEVDHILDRGLRLTNTPGEYSAVALAEHALLLMLGLAKRLKAAERSLALGRMCEPVSDELSGRVLGLIGLGWSGRELARRAAALGMRVRAVDVVAPHREELASIGIIEFGSPASLPELLSASDYVSIHVPLTAETHHMIGKAELGLMKPTAVLINVARGEVVDEDALCEALAAGTIAGAGIDVFVQEPPDPSNPLLALPNVLATPHVAGVTTGTSRRRAEACAENARRFASGRPLLHEVVRR